MTESWPELPRDAWPETRDTLHLWTQVVGKIRLALAPVEPEWGHVPLFLSARGLTTGPLAHEGRVIELAFDFIEHRLRIDVNDGRRATVALSPRTVASFYADVLATLRSLGAGVTIDPRPQEIAGAIPFDQDDVHASYDARWARRFFDVLSRLDVVMREHRGRFFGRSTPIQFYWGTFDLSFTRFSGRRAIPPPGANLLMRVSADAEGIEAGFWPGDERFPEPAFYAFGYPKPAGIESARVSPASASWSAEMGEFILRYDDVRTSESPRESLLEFLESTYVACATLAGWDIEGLRYPTEGILVR